MSVYLDLTQNGHASTYFLPRRLFALQAAEASTLMTSFNLFKASFIEAWYEALEPPESKYSKIVVGFWYLPPGVGCMGTGHPIFLFRVGYFHIR